MTSEPAALPYFGCVTTDETLTTAQAYEAAYRMVWQYMEREPDPDSVSLQEMLVAIAPAEDPHRTNDPASWSDWLRCVEETLRGTALPRFPRA